MNAQTKEAITKGDPFFLPKPLFHLKPEIRSAALSIWPDNWDNGVTGRSTHDIVPGSSLHTFIASIFEHMTIAREEKKEIRYTMAQNVGLPSPGICKLPMCHLNYSG
ncbi:hypothetical protein AVEN_157909-1 [Araneus ventricosus]|uniref:Uncharacterized protein n=1 Tax=Araneus ventricosus TaxID=182803 RepID=A0A4Y2FK88_ARAVE|nr:hypothetical protein AVEN_157909-1 [Araneus ventricosus]